MNTKKKPETGANAPVVVPSPRILFSTFTGQNALSKTIGSDGRAVASGKMVSGAVHVYHVDDLEQFAKYRATLKSSQALGYGVPKNGRVEAQVVTRDAVKDYLSGAVITRTRDHFEWPASDTILMLDHDPLPDQDALKPPALVDLMKSVCPTLTGCEMLWTPSASSCIFNLDQEIVGLRGQRLYVRLAAGVDPKVAGDNITDSLWARGYGIVVPSKAGTPLYRCPIDGSVFQPERLDYAGKPLAMPPLESRAAGMFQHYPGRAWEGPTCPDALRITKEEADRKREEALDDAADALVEARDAWVEDRVATVPEAERDAARRTFTAAACDRVLLGDFILHLDNHGERRVSDVLADRTKYHGATLADPLEPEYGGGRNKAILYLDNATPQVVSQAHGGQMFNLTAISETIEVKQGNAHEVAVHVAKVMAMQPDLFRTIAGLVRVAFDPVSKLFAPMKMDDIDTQLAAPQVVRFTCFDGRRKQMVGHNLTKDLAAQIRRATLQPHSTMRVLRGIIHAPTMTPDGRIIQCAGYDEATGLFYQPNTMFPPVPETPTAQDVTEAQDTLLRPFRAYNLPSDTDRAVLVAALLTAVVRKTLPTAPAFAVSAMQAGSGKTKLAGCLAAMTCGKEVPAAQWPSGKEEIQKTVLSLLISLPSTLLFDNLENAVASDALAAVLTSPEYVARKLHASFAPTVQTNALFLFTGNNVQVSGDLNRRVLRINITPPGIDAHAVRFDFDPLSETVRNWPGMVRAALVLMKAYMAAGRPVQAGTPFGSFEAWCRMVRDCTMWMGFTDPVAVIAQNYADDDETAMLHAVMDLWERKHKGAEMTQSDLIIGWTSTFGDEVRQVIDKRDMSLKAFTHWFGRYKDRPINGRRFVKGRTSEKGTFYKLQQI